MGQLKAALETSRVISTLSPRLIILVGIAGCMLESHDGDGDANTRATLGDLVIARQVIDYELQKVKDQGIENRWRFYRSPDALIRRVMAWAGDRTWLGNFKHPRPKNALRSPGLYEGDVFSGNSVVADEGERGRLLTEYPNAIAVEMEAAGVAAAILATDGERPDFLMIKAFTDWANGTKDDTWRDYACALAAEFTGALIDELVPTYLSELPPGEDDAEQFQRRCGEALTSYLFNETSDSAFMSSMATSILDEGLREIRTLASTVRDGTPLYRAELASDYRYLRRARPFFASASRIYATSLDWVSTFWSVPRTENLYLASHPTAEPQSVARLFVFSTPEKAHLHARRLDAHAQLFPNTFVCSREAYERLLSNKVAPDPEAYLHRDFAILDFARNGRTDSYFAELDPSTFEFTRARFDGQPDDLNLAQLIQVFHELAELPPGGWHEEQMILKWDQRDWQERDRWGRTLEKMFGDRTADVFHTIAFDIEEKEYEALRGVFAQLKYAILDGSDAFTSLAKRHGVKDVWLVRRLDRRESPVIERHTHGELYYPSSSRMGYMMMMRISDQDKLDAFLRDDENLRLRLSLWSKLGGVAAEAMDSWHMGTPEELRRAEGDRRLSYEALERLAAAKMRRYDYLDDELISEIVHADPLR